MRTAFMVQSYTETSLAVQQQQVNMGKLTASVTFKLYGQVAMQLLAKLSTARSSATWKFSYDVSCHCQASHSPP